MTEPTHSLTPIELAEMEAHAMRDGSDAASAVLACIGEIRQLRAQVERLQSTWCTPGSSLRRTFAVILERFRAGETAAHIEEDYDLEKGELSALAEHEQMRLVLARLVEWSESDDVKGAFSSAWVHGVRCTAEKSKAGASLWNEARTLAKKGES